MKKSHSRRLLAEQITRYFLPATLLGLFIFTYRTATGKFQQSAFLTLLYRLCGDDVQNLLIWCGNFLQQWIVVFLTYHNFCRHRKLLCKILNAILDCNRSLLRCVMSRTLPSGERHKCVAILRVTSTVADIWCRAIRSEIFNQLHPESQLLHLASRVVLLVSFLQWYFIQTYLLRTFLALNRFVKRRQLRAKDYERMSRLLTRVWRFKRSFDCYFEVFAIGTIMSLTRMVALLYCGLDALFFTQMKNNLLRSLKKMMALVLIPAMAPILELLTIGLLDEYLQEEVAAFRWRVFQNACGTEETDVDGQRAIDTILRQGLWENMKWVMTSGDEICKNTVFQMTLMAISWMLVFLIYDGGGTAKTGAYVLDWLGNH